MGRYVLQEVLDGSVDGLRLDDLEVVQNVGKAVWKTSDVIQ
jgi:hypothetical protein